MKVSNNFISIFKSYTFLPKLARPKFDYFSGSVQQTLITGANIILIFLFFVLFPDKVFDDNTGLNAGKRDFLLCLYNPNISDNKFNY